MAYQLKVGDSGSRNLTADERKAVDAAKKRFRDSIVKHYPAEVVREYDLAVEKVMRKYPKQGLQQTAAGFVADAKKKLISSEVPEGWTSLKVAAARRKY